MFSDKSFEKKGLMAESFASDYEEAYDEMLDEMGAAVLSQYSVSRLLKETDPIAYDVGMNDYESSLLADHQEDPDMYSEMFDEDEELTPEGEKMLKEMYDEMLDEFTIDSLLETYDASRLLKETDPIAYRVGLSDYESSMEEDEDRNPHLGMAKRRKGMMNAEFSAQGKQFPMTYKPVEYYLEEQDDVFVIRSKESGTQIELSEVYKDFAAESVVRTLNSILFNQTYRYLQEITNGKSPKIPQYSLSDASRNKNNPVIKFDGNPIFELSKGYNRLNRIFAESVAKDLNRDLRTSINGLLQFVTNKVGAGYLKDIGLNRAETFGAEGFDLIMIDSEGNRKLVGEYDTYEDAEIDLEESYPRKDYEMMDFEIVAKSNNYPSRKYKFGAEDTIEVSEEDMYADFKIRKWIRAMEEKGFSYIIRKDQTGVMYDEEGNKFYSQFPEFLVYEIDNIDDITNFIERDASEKGMKLFISDKHNEIYTSRHSNDPFMKRYDTRNTVRYFPANGFGLDYEAESSGLTRLPSDEPNFDPQKADRNKDGKISSWERTVGNKVAKGIREGRKTSSKGIDTFAEPFEDIGISKPYARLGVIAAGITALAFGVKKMRK